MNVIFLTMARMVDVESCGIYTDLMRKFRDEGCEVYIVSPRERRFGIPTELSESSGVHILGVRTLNVQKTNVIEKGLGQILIERLFQKAIEKYFKGIIFDLILYSTPPITFVNIIRRLKYRNPDAVSYLLLKDIFPQNAVDIGMLKKNGWKGILYRWFRRKERQLYGVSDYIGCMSPANVKYLLEHNKEIDASKVEIAPNSIASASSKAWNETSGILERFGIPSDRPVFIYGGNLGRPQGIPFLIGCLEANKDREDCHFVVVGSGTEYPMLAAWYASVHPKNVTVIKELPKADYDNLVRACQVGLIFLDYRFTIPNYPSRLLSYLENMMPIIACTDPNSDIGTIAEENGYGYWCPSNSVEAFTAAVDRMLDADIKQMGEKGYEFFLKNYTVENAYRAIIGHVKEEP